MGLGIIVWGTKVALDNAVLIARHYHVSDFFIGATVLAIGSDLPELLVSVNAALRQLDGEQTANLIVGNALGSCFGQFGLVMGLAGLFGQLTLPRRQVIRHGAVLLGAMALLTFVGSDGLVTRWEGAVLVATYITYLAVLTRDEGAFENIGGGPTAQMIKTWVLLLFGLGLVVVSSELIVRMALTLARNWGIDQSYIGIVIIGVGTSLPELIISIGALVRSRVTLSVGNLVGSNILDVLLPIGIAGLIVPIEFASSLLKLDVPILFALSLLVIVFLRLPQGVRKPQAIVLLSSYSAYLVIKTALL